MTNGVDGQCISIDNKYALIGNINGNNLKGSAYIFYLDGANWILETTLVASDGETHDFFGTSVSIYGEYALIGAFEDDNGRGSAYVFAKDTCCFPAGTKITMADGAYKNIEDIKIGDRVLSYNVDRNRFSSWTVAMLGNPVHPVYEINNDLIRSTKEHPLFLKKKNGKTGWGAVDVVRANDVVRLKEDVLQIEVGDQLFTSDREWIEITDITFDPVPVQTYNILSLLGRRTYFANNILVFEEHPHMGYMINWYLEKLFQRYPNAFPILRYIFDR